MVCVQGCMATLQAQVPSLSGAIRLSLCMPLHDSSTGVGLLRSCKGRKRSLEMPPASNRTGNAMSVRCGVSPGRNEAATEQEIEDVGKPEKEDDSTCYALIASLAGLGLAETMYLSYSKLTGGAVYCPIDGDGCSDVLNSDYAVIFGVPLSAIGVLAYGTVACLGVISSFRKPLRVAGINVTRWSLLACTSAMASASAYFMYLLLTKLEGASCIYCVASAVISISLVLLTLRKFSSKEIKEAGGLQLAVAASVIVALSSAYSGIGPAFTGSSDIDLPPVEPLVTTSSTPATISLAKYLQSIGAKMYGAFWCSHCYEQKQMFGQEAMKYIEYIECYPEGYRKGVRLARACEEANITGFPTWLIKGKLISGEQKLTDLSKEAGFEDFVSSNS